MEGRQILWRISVMLLAILTAYVLYHYVVDPYILSPLCLSSTNRCLRAKYYRYRNSVLIHMQPTGTWIWFNGKKIFVYGQPIGRVCESDEYEPAYLADPKNMQLQGYECILKLDKLIDYYKHVGSKPEYMYKRIKLPSTSQNTISSLKGVPDKGVGVFDVINMFQEKNIINLD